jgi:hypothetical protein
MAVMAAAPGSPYQPVLTPSGQPRGPLRDLAVLLRLDRLEGDVQMAVATVIAAVAVAAFLYLLREAFRERVSVKALVWLVVAAHVALLFVPLLFSRDVYSYAFYGRIAGVYGENPYVQTPLDHSSDMLWNYVGPKWVDTPAVYGPAWTTLSAGLSKVLSKPVDHVEAYRYLAIAASLATCAVLVRLVHRVAPRRTAFALAAFGANPVVLFHSVASGHNDLLVALAVVSALALALDGRERTAVAVLTLGALVKATAFIPLVLLVLWLVARRPVGERIRPALHLSGVIVVLAAAFALPYMQADDPTLGMVELAGHEGWLSPSKAVSRFAGWLTVDGVTVASRWAFAALLALSLAGLGRAVWNRASVPGMPTPMLEETAACGWSLMLLTLLGPVLLPWYVVWSLPLVWAMPRVARTAVIAAGAMLAVTLWSAEPLRYPKGFEVNLLVGHWMVAPALLVLVGRALLDLRSRLKTGAGLADASVGLPEDPQAEERVSAAAR